MQYMDVQSGRRRLRRENTDINGNLTDVSFFLNYLSVEILGGSVSIVTRLRDG
jgi:hypothetical protein